MISILAIAKKAKVRPLCQEVGRFFRTPAVKVLDSSLANGKLSRSLTIALAVVVGLAARVDGQLFQLLVLRPGPQELLPVLDPLEVGLTLVGVRAPRRQVLHRGGRKEVQKRRNFYEMAFS